LSPASKDQPFGRHQRQGSTKGGEIYLYNTQNPRKKANEKRMLVTSLFTTDGSIWQPTYHYLSPSPSVPFTEVQTGFSLSIEQHLGEGCLTCAP
jgi:hypothetical protein